MLSYDSPMPANQGQKDARPPTSLPPTAATAIPTATSLSVPSTNATTSENQSYKHHHIWLVTGPAGCGKTTVAAHLSEALEMPYLEGDSFHSAANIAKMASGTPLTDADRWDWLTSLREESMKRIAGGAEGVVLTCSALKRKYRDVIRVAGYYDPHLLVHFIFLDAPEEVLLDRVARRQGHYMGANMVHSQFDILERPSVDERDVFSVDVSRSIEEVKQDALSRALQAMTEDKEDGGN